MLKYPKLFSPYKYGRLTLKNRIISAPTSLAEIGPNGTLSPENIAYYAMRARGGCSLVYVGECVCHSATGLSHPQQVALDSVACLPSLKDCADAIHAYDAYAGIEFGHGGKQCAPPFVKDGHPIGPSDLFNDKGVQTCWGMSRELMEEVKEGYAKSAANVAAAGFDVICLHAGHGWLLNQFMSPLSNFRDDEYGGSLENRCRYVIEICQAIKKAAPRLMLDVRISGDELNENGYHIDTGVEIAKILEPYVDSFNVSVGVNEDLFTFIVMHPSMFLEHGCNVKYAAAVKAAVSKPVSCVGGISDADQMEEILQSGQADLVALGRALVADPDLPNKARKGNDEDIRHCLRCYGCQGQMFKTRNIVCAVNPVIGHEYLEMIRQSIPVKEFKKVAVIGGGPAGMQAAITAAQRGHEVTLYEKSDALGGALKFAQHINFKADLYRFAQWQMTQLEKLGVKVVLNTDVDLAFVDDLDVDKVICAVGASAMVPPFPGLDDKRVIFGTDMFDEGVEIGHKVVVIGGGLVGSEAALYLAENGHEVTVIEMVNDIAIDAIVSHRRAMKVRMNQCEVPPVLQVSTKCRAITPEGVTAEGPNGEDLCFEADTIICAVGLSPRTAKADELRQTEKEFVAIGDCTKSAKVLEAVAAGYNAGMNI